MADYIASDFMTALCVEEEEEAFRFNMELRKAFRLDDWRVPRKKYQGSSYPPQPLSADDIKSAYDLSEETGS